MIANKMPLCSEDLANQTALTLPEREMMDTYVFSVSGEINQVASASAENGSNVSIQQAANLCNQLVVALVIYADYSEAEAEEAYQDCMNEQDNEQEIEEEKKKHRD